jgi:hypothetical protein
MQKFVDGRGEEIPGKVKRSLLTVKQNEEGGRTDCQQRQKNRGTVKNNERQLPR